MPRDTEQMHFQADPPQPPALRSQKDSQLEHFVKNTAIKSHQRDVPVTNKDTPQSCPAYAPA